MENPIKMDDLGVPLFSETPIWYQTVTIDIVGDSGFGSWLTETVGFGVIDTGHESSSSSENMTIDS